MGYSYTPLDRRFTYGIALLPEQGSAFDDISVPSSRFLLCVEDCLLRYDEIEFDGVTGGSIRCETATYLPRAWNYPIVCA
jgi:hypothetical protein